MEEKKTVRALFKNLFMQPTFVVDREHIGRAEEVEDMSTDMGRRRNGDKLHCWGIGKAQVLVYKMSCLW